MSQDKLTDDLAAEWEANAQSVREIDADRDYRNYWRGYATALDSCARVLRARSKSTPDILRSEK